MAHWVMVQIGPSRLGGVARPSTATVAMIHGTLDMVGADLQVRSDAKIFPRMD